MMKEIKRIKRETKHGNTISTVNEDELFELESQNEFKRQVCEKLQHENNNYRQIIKNLMAIITYEGRS